MVVYVNMGQNLLIDHMFEFCIQLGFQTRLNNNMERKNCEIFLYLWAKYDNVWATDSTNLFSPVYFAKPKVDLSYVLFPVDPSTCPPRKE